MGVGRRLPCCSVHRRRDRHGRIQRTPVRVPRQHQRDNGPRLLADQLIPRLLSTFDAYGNARAAVLISADGADWSPWVTWQTGAYAGKC